MSVVSQSVASPCDAMGFRSTGSGASLALSSPSCRVWGLANATRFELRIPVTEPCGVVQLTDKSSGNLGPCRRSRDSRSVKPPAFAVYLLPRVHGEGLFTSFGCQGELCDRPEQPTPTRPQRRAGTSAPMMRITWSPDHDRALSRFPRTDFDVPDVDRAPPLSPKPGKTAVCDRNRKLELCSRPQRTPFELLSPTRLRRTPACPALSSTVARPMRPSLKSE